MLRHNWADVYERLRDLDPAAEVVAHQDNCLSWAEFDDQAARFATVLTDAGLHAGDRFAVFATDCPAYLVAVYGALKSRTVAVNVNTRYREGEIGYLLADSSAKALVFSGGLADRLADVPDLPEHLIQLDDGSGAALLPGARRFEDLVVRAIPQPLLPRSGEDRFMLYTGGTTGMPKAVVWSHADLLEVMWGASRGEDLGKPASFEELLTAVTELRGRHAQPVLMICAPLMHGMGVFQAMSALLRGGRVVLLPAGGFDAATVLDLIERHGVTDLSIVGDAFTRPLLDELDRRDALGDPADLTSLRLITSSGAAWSHHAQSQLRRRGRMILFNILGATEGGPFAWTLVGPDEEPEEVATFILSPEADLLDGNMRVITPGSSEAGIIAFRGVAATEYFQDRAKTDSVFRWVDGIRYLMIGDYATIDENRAITFLGRGSAVINTGGEKVFVEEVEEILKRHPAVADCAVVGLPDDVFGQVVAAVVQLDLPVLDVELDSHMRSMAADYKRARVIVRTDKIPRTSTGKCDYPEVRRLAQAGAARV